MAEAGTDVQGLQLATEIAESVDESGVYYGGIAYLRALRDRPHTEGIHLWTVARSLHAFAWELEARGTSPEPAMLAELLAEAAHEAAEKDAFIGSELLSLRFDLDEYEDEHDDES